MAELHVGAGQAYKTLAKARAAVKSGDVVIIHGGTYAERLVADTANVVWRAAEGEQVVIDGKWDGKTLASAPAQVAVGAAGVTLEGLTVANAPGTAIGIGKGGHEAVIRNCTTNVSAVGGIICNATGEVLRGVVIDGCVVLQSGSSWAVRKSGGVSGAINLIRCEGATVQNTVSAYNWGEGLNVGKGTTNSVVRGCTIFDNAHFCLGVNHAQDCVVEGNLLFLTGFAQRQVGGENWPSGVVIGDETGYGGDDFPPSRNIDVRGNVIINAGIGIGVRNGTAWDSYDTQLVDSAIERNTVICGPLTRAGISISPNLRGRAHQSSVVRFNAVHSDGATWPGATAADGDAQNVTWRNNAWTHPPAMAFRSADDVAGFELADAEAALRTEFPAAGHNVQLDNYRPARGGPLDAAGIGALEAVPTVEAWVMADFGQEPSAGPVPLEVRFTDRSTAGGNATITSWAWEFGDGATSVEPSPVHSYATPGTYRARLIVTDEGRALSYLVVGPEIVVAEAGPEPPEEPQPPESIWDKLLEMAAALGECLAEMAAERAAAEASLAEAERQFAASAESHDVAAGLLGELLLRLDEHRQGEDA